MSKEIKNRNSEKGNAKVKLVAVLVVLFLIGHAAYSYIPVAYEAEYFKQEMQTAVVQGMAVPGRDDDERYGQRQITKGNSGKQYSAKRFCASQTSQRQYAGARRLHKTSQYLAFRHL